MPNLYLATSNSNPDGILASEYTNVTGSNKGVILEIRRERRITSTNLYRGKEFMKKIEDWNDSRCAASCASIFL